MGGWQGSPAVGDTRRHELASAALLVQVLHSDPGLPFPLAVEVISASLPDLYVDKMLEFLASSFEASHHLEFYLLWTQKVLMLHGQKLKARYSALPCASVMPVA